MKEQSDTPRTTQLLMSLPAEIVARQLERELTAATRERDEARALNVAWAKKAETWMASPEAAQRLQGYRDLAQQVATAQNERDEARAKVERLRSGLRIAISAADGWYDDPRGRPCPSISDDVRKLAATEPKP